MSIIRSVAELEDAYAFRRVFLSHLGEPFVLRYSYPVTNRGLHALAFGSGEELWGLENLLPAETLHARTVSAAERLVLAQRLFEWDTEEHPAPRPTWEWLTESQQDVWLGAADVALAAMEIGVSDD